MLVPLFLIFALLSAVPVGFFLLNSLLARRHKVLAVDPIAAEGGVTIVLPVYREPLRIFGESLGSALAQGVPVVVVGDGCEAPYRAFALDRGARWRRTDGHRGKKEALRVGLASVETPYVLFVDSDTVLPPGAVASLRSRFTEGVGGVGANLAIKDTGHPVARCAEFVERSREVVLRAMSSRGAVMYLDGACAMYRTEAIREFVGSDAFLQLTVLGRPTRLGDDWLLTDHLLRSGYSTVKSYDTHAVTYPPSGWAAFVAQSVRWSRSGWIRLGRTLWSGLPDRVSRFYAFEMVISYTLPLLALASGIGRLRILLLHSAGTLPTQLAPLLGSMMGLGGLAAGGPYLGRAILTLAAVTAEAIFAWTAVRKISHRRLSTLAWGGVATAVLFVASLYGLLTVWKATAWRGPAPASLDCSVVPGLAAGKATDPAPRGVRPDRPQGRPKAAP